MYPYNTPLQISFFLSISPITRMDYLFLMSLGPICRMRRYVRVSKTVGNIESINNQPSTTAPANNPEVVTKEERKEMVRIIEEAEPPEG